MNNKKRMIIYGISVLTLIAVVLGTTYAIFNYTRISGQSSLSTGQVKFSTTGELLIDMKRDFPQDADLSGTDLTNMKDSHKGELAIQSHTTLTNGITYRIYAVRGDDIEGKLRLNDENIKFQLTPNFTSGENGFTVKTNDYAEPNNLVFDNEGKALLSTGIVKDTTQLTAVTYNYYMWIDGGNTLISSTTKRAILPEGNPSLADTTAGNTVADRYMKNDSTLTEEVTIFPARQEDTGKTVYTTSEFSNGYYNIKILVEAEDKVVVQSPIVKKIIKDLDTETEINFGDISSDTNGKGLYILPGTENDDYPIYYYRGAVTDNNVIFGGFCWQIVRTTETGGIKMIYNGVATGDGKTCENTAHDDRIIASSAFNTSNNSPAYVGYMYNQIYTYAGGMAETDSVFGKAVEWNGTNYLVIEDTSGTASTNTTLDENHHYTCGTASTTTCTSVRYYFTNLGSNYYYITLTGGDTVEDALYKMTGNGSSETKTKNASYVLNTTDSKAKTEIENWFKTNLTNEGDASKKNYQEYLEDTVFCNDRSYQTSGSTNTYTQSGWNPNGGSLSTYLYFGTNNRYNNSNWYSASNIPSMACENVTDRFSVSNQEAKLKYPVGLLTVDEIILAGSAGNSPTTNKTYYLHTENYYWSLSPTYFNYSAVELNVYNGYISIGYNVNDSLGLRPSVSLKLGTEFEDGGEGTSTNPYVVKYE